MLHIPSPFVGALLLARSLSIDFFTSLFECHQPQWPIWVAGWDKETLNKLQVCDQRFLTARRQLHNNGPYISLLLCHYTKTQRANEILHLRIETRWEIDLLRWLVFASVYLNFKTLIWLRSCLDVMQQQRMFQFYSECVIESLLNTVDC